MRKQSAKNKLMDLVTGSNKTGIPIIMLNEDEELDTSVYDPKTTTIIRFVDFRKRNESKQETKSALNTSSIIDINR